MSDRRGWGDTTLRQMREYDNRCGGNASGGAVQVVLIKLSMGMSDLKVKTIPATPARSTVSRAAQAWNFPARMLLFITACRTHYKVVRVGGEESEGHLLCDTTSRGRCGRI